YPLSSNTLGLYALVSGCLPRADRRRSDWQLLAEILIRLQGWPNVARAGLAWNADALTDEPALT
ncbi:MAG: hypothetical protein ABN489_09635, partial [Pseudomonas amygdali]